MSTDGVFIVMMTAIGTSASIVMHGGVPKDMIGAIRMADANSVGLFVNITEKLPEFVESAARIWMQERFITIAGDFPKMSIGLHAMMSFVNKR